ncbi:serine hydrolase [Pelagibacterium xiamenense]|uniref:serine hydrolase n=1 Tax=Pelagibacterium xiamenense TaxID=2901140 RepID=UPI001E3A8A1A|nr:serine hydrolase [Pelagibacterium xiamenense]MCD7059526.1 serine hydrolase [Pelagibacterium xiamenense]
MHKTSLICLFAATALAAVPVFAQTVVPGPYPGADVTEITESRLGMALSALPAYVEDTMERSGVPGIAVAVVHDGELVFAEGFGVREIGTSDPITPETVFMAASVSKPVSATVAAAAVFNNEVDWDDVASSHLPTLALSDPYVRDHATIGDFFAHRSGLPHAAGDDLEDLGFDRDTIIARLLEHELDRFRLDYAYSNFGITIGAEAVAAAAGMAWEDLADAYIFEPVGMPHSSYRHADYMAAENRAVIHAMDTGAPLALFERDADPQAPAGGLSTNVLDMANWLNLVLSGGTAGSREVFAPDDLLPAVQPQIVSGPSPAADGRSDAYGYGFNVGVTPTGRVMLSHSGAFVLGAATRVVLLPGDDLGIVVLTNAGPVGAAEAIGAYFIDLYQFGEASRDWFAGFNGVMQGYMAPVGDLAGLPTPPDAPENPDPSLYVGTYENAYFGPLTIAEDAEGLVAELGPAPQRFRLEPWAQDVFAISPRTENAPRGSRSSVTFAKREDGARTVRIDYLDTDGLGTWMEEAVQ